MELPTIHPWKKFAVKGYVKSVLEVIDESKKNQLKEEELKADMRHEIEYDPAAHQCAAAPTEMRDVSERSDTRDVSEKSKGLRRRLMKKPKSPEAGSLGTPERSPLMLFGNAPVALSARSMLVEDSAHPAAALQVVQHQHVASPVSPVHMESAQAHHKPQPPPAHEFSPPSGTERKILR
jgi:hypothetical protein